MSGRMPGMAGGPLAVWADGPAALADCFKLMLSSGRLPAAPSHRKRRFP
jgi:hypothetical protein